MHVVHRATATESSHDYALSLYSNARMDATRGVTANVAGQPPAGDRVRVGIVGATGYVGAELIRILARHPFVELVGLQARGRAGEPVGATHPHLASTGLVVDDSIAGADAVFLAMPHGASSALAPGLAAGGVTVIDLGPDFRLRDPADYPR